MIGPLIENVGAEAFYPVAEHILRNDGGAQTGYEPIDTVVDLWIQMVRPTAENYNRLLLFSSGFDHFFSLFTNSPDIIIIFLIGCLCGFRNLW